MTVLRQNGPPPQGPPAPLKEERRLRYWQHPRDRALRVPYRAAAAIALFEMGFTDLKAIAVATRLTAAEVATIDRAEDPALRELSCRRIPAGEFFRLERVVRCPRCQGRVQFVPCIACQADEEPRT